MVIVATSEKLQRIFHTISLIKIFIDAAPLKRPVATSVEPNEQI